MQIDLFHLPINLNSPSKVDNHLFNKALSLALLTITYDAFTLCFAMNHYRNRPE